MTSCVPMMSYVWHLKPICPSRLRNQTKLYQIALLVAVLLAMAATSEAAARQPRMKSSRQGLVITTNQERQPPGLQSKFRTKSGKVLYPWLSRSDKRLKIAPTENLPANITVAQDGTGNVRSIAEAIKMAPKNSAARYIIKIKAGKYIEENLIVGKKKINIWIIGEGKGQTIISGNKSVHHNKISNIETATFAAWGDGLVLQHITFENDAGPANYQAVALLVAADRAVVYRCEIKGYQDTLYVYHNHQFYRECDIYGTVDFIFGDATAVFQNCTIWARKPLDKQMNVIVAQSRARRRQHTGISIHSCQIRATMDLDASKSSIKTYLGRPWKKFSRVVYLESYIGDHIDPKGWLEWDAKSSTNNLYYGEYNNFGPRADTTQRVNWSSLHVNLSREEVEEFTVSKFLRGEIWINTTGVSYIGGLLT